MNNFDPTRQIAIIWDIDDVKGIAKGITDEQAMNVLHEVDWNHDSEYGVTWETIESWVNELYPEIETNLNGFNEEEKDMTICGDENIVKDREYHFPCCLKGTPKTFEWCEGHCPEFFGCNIIGVYSGTAVDI